MEGVDVGAADAAVGDGDVDVGLGEGLRSVGAPCHIANYGECYRGRASR